MRPALLLISVLLTLVTACTGGGGTLTPVPFDEVTSTPPPTELSSSWTPELVIDEIASQLFASESRPVHIFGLNVEEGEEFVPSGRDVLPLPPNTSTWSAEFEGAGVWIVDTGALIYRFEEADMSFAVIYEYAGE